MTMQTNQAHQTHQIYNDMKFENFDDVWGSLGNPALVEKKFLELLPEAQKLENKSMYLQMLSQLALAQALMKHIDVAHTTLDAAQAQLNPDYNIARARIFLERGRIFQQAADSVQAKIYFEKSYEISKQYNFEIPMIDAAHMIAIAVDTTESKIAWNHVALDLIMKSNDTQARRWLGSVWNNLGANYLDEKQFEKALHAFEKTLEYRLQENYAPNVRFAKFRIGQILRILGRLEKALMVQQELLLAYEAMAKSGNLDITPEMFTLTRGWIYEEFIELYAAAVKGYAKLAYADLSTNEWFAKTEPDRLERLQKIKNS